MRRAGEEIELRKRHLYNWDVILNGETWICTAGEDFNCSPKSFREMACSAAKKRGLKAATRIRGKEVLIRAFPRN